MVTLFKGAFSDYWKCIIPPITIGAFRILHWSIHQTRFVIYFKSVNLNLYFIHQIIQKKGVNYQLLSVLREAT